MQDILTDGIIMLAEYKEEIDKDFYLTSIGRPAFCDYGVL